MGLPAPDLVGQGVHEEGHSEPLEDLQACISALVAKAPRGPAGLARLEEENQQLRGSPSRRGEPGVSAKSSASLRVAALEQDLGKLGGKSCEPVQATMAGRARRLGKLKQLLLPSH